MPPVDIQAPSGEQERGGSHWSGVLQLPPKMLGATHTPSIPQDRPGRHLSTHDAPTSAPALHFPTAEHKNGGRQVISTLPHAAPSPTPP